DDAKNPHRNTRNAGFVACLAGVLLMISGRFVAGFPPWTITTGVGVILLGWALFAWSFFKRANG
ncbi:MAG: hypothetical protein ABI906_08370, partial [Pseudomonadota bacterium]